MIVTCTFFASAAVGPLSLQRSFAVFGEKSDQIQKIQSQPGPRSICAERQRDQRACARHIYPSESFARNLCLMHLFLLGFLSPGLAAYFPLRGLPAL